MDRKGIIAAENGQRIHDAINKGFFQQVRFHIDQGSNVNSRDNNGKTPLILCAYIDDEKWSVGLARLLIEHGARISKCDKYGYNSLHHACINQKPQLIDIYMSALDCDVHSKCKKGNTSLHYAASLGNSLIIRSLAQLAIKYKLSLDPQNKSGCTPLHQAFKANHLDCGDLLMQLGADGEVMDNENKTATLLRKECIERLDLISNISQARTSTKLLRKLEREAESVKPKPDTTTIQKARDIDLRNDPEYVFNISAVRYFQDNGPRMLIGRPKTAPNKRTKDKKMWQDEILRLWSQYETQCSISFRSPARPSSANPTSYRFQRGDSVFSNHASPTRRNSRMGLTKSRTGSLTQDGSSRRPSTTRRPGAGMPPIVRAQSRTSFNHTGMA